MQNHATRRLALSALFLAVGCSHSKEPRAAQYDLLRFPGPVVSPQKVVPLTASTLDPFLDWAQQVPQSRVDLIKQQALAASTDPAVALALSKRLLELPVVNVDKHLMILAVMGESRNPQFIEPLKKFIWSREPVVTESVGGGTSGSHVSFFSHGRALQSRAAEMLAYIGNAEAFAAARDVISKHPAVEVRIAAIDAYMFNHADSPQARDEITRLAAPGDSKMIGIPRRTRDMNVREFDERMRAFYARYPEEKAPVPQRSSRAGNVTNQTVPAKAPAPSLSH